MKANIQITLWIPLVFLALLVVFLFLEFDILQVIIILGVLIIESYFIFGYVKRKDALVIDENNVKATTPFSTKTFVLKDITSISLEDNGTILRGIYQGEKTKLITNIYDVSLTEIKDYLLTHCDHIKEEKA